MNKTAEIYDTTLRDGTQAEGLSPTVGEKLRVVRLLDELGVHFIEGGWPGANPKDDEFFARATRELDLERSRLVAFGSTRRPRGAVERGRPAPGVARRGHRVHLHRRQIMGPPRDRCPQYLSGGGSGHGRRVDRISSGTREAGLLRRRALLRRLPQQPDLCPVGGGDGRWRRRRAGGPLRHQRRRPALRYRAGSRGRVRAASRPSWVSTSTMTPTAPWPTP